MFALLAAVWLNTQSLLLDHFKDVRHAHFLEAERLALTVALALHVQLGLDAVVHVDV